MHKTNVGNKMVSVSKVDAPVIIENNRIACVRIEIGKKKIY